MLNISPGVIISMMGVIGMAITFIEGSGFIGSKIPLTVFFLFIIILGILYEAYPKDKLNDVYGEIDGRRDFS